jgi:thiol:disulfide interchange protein DsbD
MQEITPPASLKDPSVQLGADANWLVCEKICIPGSAKLTLDLPVAAESAIANEEVFSRFRRSLPQSWPDPKVARASWKRQGAELQLTVESTALASYPAADFFPLPEPSVVVSHPKTERAADGKIVFRVPIETADKNLSALDGIVVFARTRMERAAMRGS